MENSEALRIVQALAEGRDPATGETCTSEFVFQQAEVSQALARAAEALQAETVRNDRNRELPANVGTPWLPPEDEQLCSEFEQGMSISQMANAHKRTYKGITLRLEKLGKIAPGGTTDAGKRSVSAVPTDPEKPWLAEEDEQLCLEFYGSVDFNEIADHLGRTRRAIVSRLVALGKIRPKAPPSAA